MLDRGMTISIRATIAIVLSLLCACNEYTTVGSACAAIVDGTEVTLGPMYSTVGVRGSTKVICTGVYVAPGVVLTAAHCGTPASVLSPDKESFSGVLEAIPHPRYANDPHGADIMILLLERELPLATASIAIPQYGQALIQGFGTDGETSGVLREAYVYVEEFLAPATLLATSGGGNGADTCYGDSGGPIYQGGAVVGLTRSGLPGYEGMDSCGPGGLYTIIHSHRDWLDSEIDGLNWVGSC